MSYRIKISGVLDQSWSDWLGGVNIVTEPAEGGSLRTILTVDANDPSKLFGILDHIRDLNITLVSVNTSDKDEV